MARQSKSSDQTLIELFLDMLAAERGAGVNTLSAYRRDIEDLSATLAKKGGSIARAAMMAVFGRPARIRRSDMVTGPGRRCALDNAPA